MEWAEYMDYLNQPEEDEKCEICGEETAEPKIYNNFWNCCDDCYEYLNSEGDNNPEWVINPKPIKDKEIQKFLNDTSIFEAIDKFNMRAVI
jgi:ribosome-binding protein aMBF1 (putative translation factor)